MCSRYSGRKDQDFAQFWDTEVRMMMNVYLCVNRLMLGACVHCVHHAA